MIYITAGTLEEQIITLLQKTYPITMDDLQKRIPVGRAILLRALKKLQTRGILRLEPLPGKTYIRLLRNDFSFIRGKNQRKALKHRITKKKPEPKSYEGIMYS